MDNLDETLKDLRMKIAEDPEFSAEEIIESEPGKSYEISGKMEFAGAFHKDGRIKVLVRLYDYLAHEDIIEEAFDIFEDEVKERITEMSSEIEPKGLDIYLMDAMYQEDIDDACSEYKIE